MAMGVYLHIPFCVQKCLYCDFNSYAGKGEEDMERYLFALMQEIKNFSSKEIVDTIYFGGGTPTAFGAHRIALLLQTIKEQFSLSLDCEITVECNPGTIEKDGLRTLKEAGCNRLSIGLQSTDDKVLKSLGRIHGFDDFKRCFSDARAVGFSSLSFDLMYGLPNQTLSHWLKTLEDALIFSPEHLSCYALKVEEGTPFYRMQLSLPDDEVIRQMYDEGTKLMEKAGFVRYEVSNFAKSGKESRHNIKYWQCDDFVGFGAGAYSCIGDCRYDNLCSIEDYCHSIETQKSARKDQIPLSLQDKMSEFCFLGLRMTKGISKEGFYRRFGIELEDVFGDVLEKNLRRGTMEKREERYRISSDYIYVSNGILADFV